MAQHGTSLELLFVSKVRIKALHYFLLHPKTPIHLRGAVRELKEEINAVRRELMRLEDMKLITADKQGNRKYFKLNEKHPFLSELLGMFHKSFGLGAAIVQNQQKLGSISFALLTASYTKEVYIGDQVIDLAIIGDVHLEKLQELIKDVEHSTGREIHYTVMKDQEFETRKRRKDEFLTSILFQEHVMLIGDHADMVR